ncbi:transglycosylase SLT domain-containing protein [Glycomyces sp. YM15]|uniref:transglycosylase SLT domain-containing protein n=1 Tax=Glycomyces sp. YM15 TaxID=2800446 RepID=UPI001963EB1D|nr:transglycosylase SLT domain-containing protein [Glycomyces sp. YM15]
MTDAPLEFDPDLEPDDDSERAPVTWIVLFVLLFATVAIVAYLILPSSGDGGAAASATTAAAVETEAASASPSASPSPEPLSEPAPSAFETTSAAETTAPELPIVPPSEHPPCTTYLDGGAASFSEVETALEDAADTQFWTNSSVDVPDDLIKAVAWMESGWQSDIVACDGGTGLMQIQPETEQFINDRFELDLDRTEVEANALLGSAQLQWLAKYFSVNYFDGDDPGGYSLADDCGRDSDVPDHLERCLLNAVISAYQAGFGTVEAALDAGGDPDYTNPQYIETVRALLELRPWA